MAKFIQMACEECDITYGCLETAKGIFTYCVDCKKIKCIKDKKILHGLCSKHRNEFYRQRTNRR